LSQKFKNVKTLDKSPNISNYYKVVKNYTIHYMAKSTDKSNTYFPDATAKCTNCGSIYKYGSTLETLSVEVCGNCHPFYTGKAVVLDTAGRIEKFQSRLTKVVTAEKTKSSKVRKQVQSLSDIMVEEEAPAEEAPKPKAVAKPAPKSKATDSTSDELTKIEGIGPKIAELLTSKGYGSFELLAKADVADLTTILEENSLGGHKADTWSKQSQMAFDGKWDELKTWQEEMDGGKA
jgi:ribosomal protein L31